MRIRTVSILYPIILVLVQMASELWDVAHTIATVLWYLGFARHESEILIPAEFLNVCEELVGQQE